MFISVCHLIPCPSYLYVLRRNYSGRTFKPVAPTTHYERAVTVD